MDQLSEMIFEEDGLYSIVFTDFPDNLGGYELESAIKATCKDENIDISKLDFDSESDMFAVYSPEKDLLQPIASIIDVFISKPKSLVSVIDFKNEGIITDEIEAPEEFIENLKYMGFDLSKSRQIAFYIEFTNEQCAKAACKECSQEGYQCLLDLRVEDEVNFAAITNSRPMLNELNEKINYFQYIAKKHEGKFDYYDDYENEDLVDGTYGSEWFVYGG